MEVLNITPTDTRYTLREALRRTATPRVLVVLPWDVEKGWDLPLDFELLLRMAIQEQREVAWVVEDPDKRALPRKAGFPVFKSEEAAQTALDKAGHFPPLSPPTLPERPRAPWWAERPRPTPLPLPRQRHWWQLLLELAGLAIVLLTVGALAFLTLPSAQISLIPQGSTYSIIAPVSVDQALAAGEIDLQRNLIPSRRVGDEFEAYAEVPTAGRGYSFSGKASGSVIFTNMLGQNYRVPKNTVVRTSAGSFPVRFVTTAEVTVPPFGQAEAPIEAKEEGPRGNVAAYQINFVEGVVGFALKVTNPTPITGAESSEVAIVSEADTQRVWALAAEKVLQVAYEGLQSGDYLQAGEFLPRQTLVIQSVPKTGYTHIVGEQADTLGLSLRLLVTGEVVNGRDVQAVAYRRLAGALPTGYTLTDTRFAYGESAEEDVGPGRLTFYVTAYGYATAELDGVAIHELIQGRRHTEAREILTESLALARPPEITVKPDWFPFIPWLPIRTTVEIVPGHWSGE
ncbi:MAG: baseplate J/gp47 family protein [Chloroflexota bacterium]|nr:baseplate J/gp47 family protein [Chloroflexota bacterium]